MLLSSHLLGESDGGLRVEAPSDRVGLAALAAGVALSELRPAGHDLEHVFLELTSGGDAA